MASSADGIHVLHPGGGFDVAGREDDGQVGVTAPDLAGEFEASDSSVADTSLSSSTGPQRLRPGVGRAEGAAGPIVRAHEGARVPASLQKLKRLTHSIATAKRHLIAIPASSA